MQINIFKQITDKLSHGLQMGRNSAAVGSSCHRNTKALYSAIIFWRKGIIWGQSAHLRRREQPSFYDIHSNVTVHIKIKWWLFKMAFVIFFWGGGRIRNFGRHAISISRNALVHRAVKSKPTRKLRHANSILESFEYFCQMSSKFILAVLSYTSIPF